MSTHATNLLVGIILTFVVGITVNTCIYFGIDRDLATLIILLSINMILLYIYHEEFILNNIWPYIISATIIGFIYYYISYIIEDTNVSITNSNGVIGIFIYFINISILIPLYEEFVVRKLIFISGKEYIGMPASIMMTSLLFAMVHDGIFIWAFIFSVILCVMANFRVNVYKRSIFHGSYNLTFSLMLLISANTI